MRDIRYVVSSLPRSGTKYIAGVLSNLGLLCGHESHFNYNTSRTSIEIEGSPIWGDASWLAMPYISELPSGTVVLHQLRDPIKVLNSNLPPGGDSYFRTWDDNAGLPSDPLYRKRLPWKRFIWENTQDWVWPDKIATEPESAAEIERLVFWWMNWNLSIETLALKRSDLTYVRYKLEDLNSEMLFNIVKLLDPDSSLKEEDCSEVLGKVSKTTNRHRTPNNKITVDILPPAARLLMMRYGYDSI